MNIFLMAKESELGVVRTVDDLVTMHAAIKMTMQSYDELELTAPEWMAARLGEIAVEIKDRDEAEKRGKLRKLLARREQLKSAEEKRKDVEADIEALRKELGE